jgi:hypothetical protein
MRPDKLRERARGRRSHSFIALPKDWLGSPQWAALDSFEVKLLIDLAAQYNGSNNGDLCASWSMMKRRGWRSSATLHKALRGLIENGWLELTRQGGRHVASLYALTFWGIDPCGGKLDVAANPVPSHRWKSILGARVVNQCSRVANQLPAELGKKAA